MGWTSAPNSGLTDGFVYMKPGIKRKSDGVLGETMFSGEENLLEYVKANMQVLELFSDGEYDGDNEEAGPVLSGECDDYGEAEREAIEAEARRVGRIRKHKLRKTTSIDALCGDPIAPSARIFPSIWQRLSAKGWHCKTQKTAHLLCTALRM